VSGLEDGVPDRTYGAVIGEIANGDLRAGNGDLALHPIGTDLSVRAKKLHHLSVDGFSDRTYLSVVRPISTDPVRFGHAVHLDQLHRVRRLEAYPLLGAERCRTAAHQPQCRQTAALFRILI